jgi:arylsulfate sulfotransferase
MPRVNATLSDDQPPIRIEHCEPERREPGMILFNVREDRAAKNARTSRGWLMGINRSGEIVCLHKSDLPVQGVRHMPSGNLLVTIIDGLVMEMTLSGAILRQWYATGKWRHRKPPENAIPIEAETFHHGVNLGSASNLLLLSMEIRQFDNWPGSTTDPAAPRERAKVVGDIVMEVYPDGNKVNEWRMLDLLDPYRITYGSRAKYWVARGYPGTNDWCHANGTAYDPKDDTILVSLRTQDCIIKFDRKTGVLRWILGAHGNWRAPWADKLLTPVGPLSWNFHQHDCSITPTGTILCFDNGNHRALPFEPAVPHAENFSRAVEFAVDETKGTVTQVWSYGDGPGERLFAGFQGGALRMPETGNTLITYGGICTRDGRPVSEPDGAEVRARLIEVTAEKEIVLDVRIGGGPNDAKALSAFRSELVPR